MRPARRRAGDLARVNVSEPHIRNTSVHPTAIVETGAIVGPGTRIWHHSHVRSGSRIGARCRIGFGVYVDTDVVIGDRCKIQNHVSVYRGAILEDDVFVGPGVMFTNDRYPRADAATWEVVRTHVRAGASVGANATIVCGVEVGERSMVGAGSVVTTDVPSHGLVMGTPARLHGWVCTCGRPLARRRVAIPDRCAHCGWHTTELTSS
jgi:UDP-2-acetamido-3-amino-2,3-dideoxy-glucuronate N-acetyltransferase